MLAGFGVPMQERLQHVLDAHCLPCGAVIAAPGVVVARAGDFEVFASAGLVSAMLGPYGSAEATYHMMRNPEQVTPGFWAQGGEFAFLYCAGEFVIVVFGRNRGDKHALSLQVGQAIANEFRSPDFSPTEERALNRWREVRDEFLAWLREFPLQTNIGKPNDSPEVIGPTDTPVHLDVAFWSERTHEAEARARRHLTDTEIDGIFDEVAAVIDENLLRFDPLVAYYGRFFPDGDPGRIEEEREAANCVKRDLGWAATERAINEPAFFCALLAWYDRGRWPVGWAGNYPAGHVRVL